MEVSLRRLATCIRMQIRDNGKAFDAAATLSAGKGQRMGLLGMRERIEMVDGKLLIESVAGRGTTITAQVPFARSARGKDRS